MLAATYPIESAPPAPRVTAVVVEQAEHLTVARLQRIKGMLGKSVAPAKVYYVVGPDCSDEQRARLEKVINAESGAALAELLAEDSPATASTDMYGPYYPSLIGCSRLQNDKWCLARVPRRTECCRLTRG